LKAVTYLFLEVKSMRFNLEVSLDIEGSKTFSRGNFTVQKNIDIPVVAYQYIKRIKRETGYRTTLIEKVKVNGSEDITEQVKEIENRPFADMDDVFW
jgi:hypothetical protein